jgi:hypothetical protein
MVVDQGREIFQKVRRAWRAGLILFLIFGSAWLLPPLVHHWRHLCPVKPDGVAESYAVPAFARKYGVSCSQCHTAWPDLNAYGRWFKIQGYVRELGSTDGVMQAKDGGGLWTEKNFPIAAVVISRPYDKGTTGQGDYSSGQSEARMRALQDMTLFIAGGDVSNHMSYFMATDFADNNDGNTSESTQYSPQVTDIQVGYHPDRYINIMAGNRSFWMTDPYQTLSNAEELTITPRPLSAAGFLAGDSMDGNKDTLAEYGTLALAKDSPSFLYYSAGYSAGVAASGSTAQPGALPSDVAAELDLDSGDGLMVGAFADNDRVIGDLSSPVTYDFTAKRIGGQTLIEQGGFTFRGVFMAEDDKNIGTTEMGYGRAAYGELFYTFMNKDGIRPLFVPLVREDWIQGQSGSNTTASSNYAGLTLGLTQYVTQNAKLTLEYAMAESAAGPAVGGDPKEHRWVGQMAVGF